MYSLSDFQTVGFSKQPQSKQKKGESRKILLFVVIYFCLLCVFGRHVAFHKRRIISVLAFVRRVIDFLKCPGYLSVPL